MRVGEEVVDDKGQLAADREVELDILTLGKQHDCDLKQW